MNKELVRSKLHTIYEAARARRGMKKKEISSMIYPKDGHKSRDPFLIVRGGVEGYELPNLEMLCKYADALGCHLEMKFLSRKERERNDAIGRLAAANRKRKKL